jgi:hypothetical protein
MGTGGAKSWIEPPSSTSCAGPWVSTQRARGGGSIGLRL